MSRPFRRILVTMSLLVASAMGWAQPVQAQELQPNPNDSPTYTIRSSARLVPLDVVVTDKKGKPVHGLAKGAFHIKEDGEPQPITVFEEHGAKPPQVTKLPPMGDGTYTNYPTATVSDSVTVLLLDSLNTGLADQAYVHQQILQFLKTVPPGTQVAIFTLASRLRMLQSFTADPAILQAVVKNKKALPKSSVFAGTEFDPAANAGISVEDPTINVADSLGSFEGDIQTFQQQQRVQITMEALIELGQYLIGIPGRKNLVWFAGNFPLGLSAGPTGTAPAVDLTPDAAERRALIDTYIQGRISVYPVSAVGLQTSAFTSASQSNRAFAANPANVTTASIQQANNRANERIPMEKLAEDTGGKAFFDTNGLKQAIDTAVNEGEHFYSLAYVPADHEFDQKFHKIEVTVEGNYKVSYRRGYYADGPDGVTPLTASQTNSYMLEDAMVRGVPNATSIVFKVHVGAIQRPEGAAPLGDQAATLKGKTVRYAIDYAASMRAMKITKTADGVRHASLTFAAVAYDIDGKALNSLTQEIKVDMKPEAVTEYLRTGLKYEQVLDLPATPLFLKVGISDPGNGKIGTMEIPLQPKPPLPPAPAPTQQARPQQEPPQQERPQ